MPVPDAGTISSPWYETWWFWSIVGGVAITTGTVLGLTWRGRTSGVQDRRFVGCTMIRLSLLALCLLACGSITAGCGDDDQGELGIAVQLVQLPGADAFGGVSFVRVSVEADGKSVGTVKQSTFNAEGGSVSLDGIPFGEGRQVVVEGWSATADGQLGFLVSRGRSAPVTVNQGDKSTDVNVLIAPVNQFHSMTSFLDGNTQASCTRTGQSHGEDRAGEVLVIGGGTIEAESAWWGPGGFTSFSKSVK